MSKTNSNTSMRLNFILIGAQRAGTTWLWKMLKQHPGTDLPQNKEPHFFGSSEHYKQKREWYRGLFKGLDSNKIIGEASTFYFYDRVPFFYNPSGALEFDPTLPTIPELILKEYPNIKILVSLRNPVKRAISSYRLYMNLRRTSSPLWGLKHSVKKHPRLRIVEYGRYARFIKIWKKFIPPEKMRVLVFEEDIREKPKKTLQDVYRFLNLDSSFTPQMPNRAIHQSMGYTRLLLKYYGKRSKRFSNEFINHPAIAAALDKLDRYFKLIILKTSDIAFLRAAYQSEKKELEPLIGRNLDSWELE